MCVLSGIKVMSTSQLNTLHKLLIGIVDAYDALLRVTVKDWKLDFNKMISNQELLREVEAEIAIRNQ